MDSRMETEIFPEVKNFLHMNFLVTKQIYLNLKNLRRAMDESFQKLFDKIESTHSVLIRHNIGDEPTRSQLTPSTNRFTCFYCSMVSIDVYCLSVMKLLIHVLFMHNDIKLSCKFTQENKGSVLHLESYRVCDQSELNVIHSLYLGKQLKAKRVRKNLVMDAFRRAFSEELKNWKSKKTLQYLSEDSDEEDKPIIEKGFNKELKPEEIKNYLRKKGNTFYHSTNLFDPIGSDSLLEESEKEVDEKPIREVEDKAINEFDDIDERDKQYFKLWNGWVRDFNNEKRKKGVAHHILNESNFTKFVSDFIAKNKLILMSYRHNFLMHLITLQVYNLISSNDICLLLLELDQNVLTIN